MAAVQKGRFTADVSSLGDEVVVFLIGMRINKPWKVKAWWPVFTAMPKMVKELQAAGPASGFLGTTPVKLGVIAQYWRSFEQLEAYARSHDQLHWPAWVAFNRRIKGARGDVGIWHETYLVKPGQYEAVYSGMPPYGLGKAGRLIPATGKREDARTRMTAAGSS